MGAACCVAARDATISTRHESVHRNITCSPSWSLRLDQRRVAGEVEDSSYHVSHRNSRSAEIKGSVSSERGNLSDGGSIENFGTPASFKSPIHEETGINLILKFWICLSVLACKNCTHLQLNSLERPLVSLSSLIGQATRFCPLEEYCSSCSLLEP